MMRKYKRRNYFTNKKYQGWIALRIILICALGLFINLSVFNYLSYEQIESMRWKMHIPAHRLGDIIIKHLLYSISFILLLTILALYIFLRHTLKKTCKPLSRLNANISRIAEGDLSFGMQFREGDHFEDLSNVCNRLIDSFRGRFSVMKDDFLSIHKTTEILHYIKDRELSAKKCRELTEMIESVKKGIPDLKYRDS